MLSLLGSQANATPSTFNPNNVTTQNIKMEGCYGIAKKRMNDCGTSSHACAGQQVSNNSQTDFIMVLEGNCAKITGGLKSPACSQGCVATKKRKG